MYLNKAPYLAGPVSAQSLTSAAVVAQYALSANCLINRLMFSIGTATVSSGNIVVTFYKRVAVGVSAGQVSLGTLTIPTGVAAGAVYYKDISPVAANCGQVISVEVTTAAAGGGAAGAGVGMVELQDDPEQPANVSVMVASA